MIQKKIDAFPNCLLNFVPPLTVSSWHFYRAPVDTLTVLEEPPSNTSFFNTSNGPLVTNYYQATARLLRSFISSLRSRLRNHSKSITTRHSITMPVSQSGDYSQVNIGTYKERGTSQNNLSLSGNYIDT